MPKTTSMKCLCLVIITIWQQQLTLLFKAIKKGFMSYHFWPANTQEVISNCADTEEYYATVACVQLSQKTHWAFAPKQMDLLVILQVKRDQWGYFNTRNNGWLDSLVHQIIIGYAQLTHCSRTEKEKSCLASQPISPLSTPAWSNLCFCNAELYVL